MTTMESPDLADLDDQIVAVQAELDTAQGRWQYRPQGAMRSGDPGGRVRTPEALLVAPILTDALIDRVLAEERKQAMIRPQEDVRQSQRSLSRAF